MCYLRYVHGECYTIYPSLVESNVLLMQPAFAEAGVMEEFGVSRTVAILPVSLFLMGVGTGPMVIGPLSEVYGALCDFHSFTEH